MGMDLGNLQNTNVTSTEQEKNPLQNSLEDTKQKLSIVIPCYNEEQGIKNLAEKLLPKVEEWKEKYEIELLLVDDGSNDKTPELLKEYFGNRDDSRILTHSVNKNLGAALKTGFNAATGDIISALDSDCTYDPEVIEKMLSMLDEQTDIVTVSLHHPDAGANDAPAYRIFLSKAISWIYGVLVGGKIYSYTAMVRVYKREVLDSITFHSNSFLSVTEIMVKALLKKYKVKELPVPLRKREFGTSKIKLTGVIVDHLKLIWNVVLFRLFHKSF